jgi:Outer membrane receptor for monomeric catechols
MAFIKSRKHALSSHPLLAGTGRGTAAILLASLALAMPAAAADLSADNGITDAQIAQAKTLPGVKVEAEGGPQYRVEKLSSPKFTQPLLDTTQTVSVITKA